MKGISFKIQTCTKFINPNKELIFVSTLLLRILAEGNIDTFSKILIEKWNLLPYHKFPKDSIIRLSKIEMLSERFFKVIANIISVSSLYYILM
jgi:hypothetical protein